MNGTMRMPLIAGRDFTGADARYAPKVAIVNEAFARKFFSSLNPLGRIIRVGVYDGRPKPPVEVVGIVGDAKYMSLRAAMPPTVFMPLEQYPEREGRDVFEVRTAVQPSGLIRAVVAAVAGVSREIPLGLSPVIRIISLTYESIRMILEAWSPDPFPKSPLPRRFQPTPK